jgi:hypothetical protein
MEASDGLHEVMASFGFNHVDTWDDNPRLRISQYVVFLKRFSDGLLKKLLIADAEAKQYSRTLPIGRGYVP